MQTIFVHVAFTEAEVYQGGLPIFLDYDVVVLEVVVGPTNVVQCLKAAKDLLTNFQHSHGRKVTVIMLQIWHDVIAP